MVLSLPWLESTRRRSPWDTRISSALVVPALDMVVSPELLYVHARLQDESLLQELLPLRIRAATAWCERYTGLACLEQTWTLTIHGEILDPYPILLPMCPVLAVESVTSYDVNNASTVFSAALYETDLVSRPGRVILDSGQAWPSSLRLESSMVVRYRAGHTDTDLIPPEMKVAILEMAAEMTERPEAATDLKLVEVPIGVKNLLDPLRTMANV